VFTSPVQVNVCYGSAELGTVDPISLRRQGDKPLVLQLGGRAWQVTSVDWGRRIAWVEPSASQGRTRWVGTARALGFALCQAEQRVLAGTEPGATLSCRAATRLDELREELPFCQEGSTALVTDDQGVTRWWTFAGHAANSVLAQALACTGTAARSFDNFGLTLEPEAAQGLVSTLAAGTLAPREASWDPWMEQVELKFSLCLPERLAQAALVARLTDPPSAARVLAEPLRQVRADTKIRNG